MHRGVGDDAALLAPSPGCELAVSVDMLVAGRHFLPDVDPEKLGHKTLAVNLSDMAAMGATPRWALLAGALPDLDAAWLAAFARGFYALADRHGVELVGGDTTRGPLEPVRDDAGRSADGTRADARGRAAPATTSMFRARSAMLRSRSRRSTGRAALDAEALAAARERLETPTPRIALGIALRGVATAALDVSDGLTGDLGHILERSGVGATSSSRPCHDRATLDRLLAGAERALALDCLLAGGDDYELCFTAPRAAAARVAAIAAETGVAADAHRHDHRSARSRRARRARRCRCPRCRAPSIISRDAMQNVRSPALLRLRRALDHEGAAASSAAGSSSAARTAVACCASIRSTASAGC